MTNLINIVMKNINTETIKSDLDEHKKIVNDIKQKKENKKDNNIKSIQEFVESIELF